MILFEQWGQGYVIGTRGPAAEVKSKNYAEGLVPQSLYEDELRKRLGR